jgi:hypothetical protein
LKKVTSAFEYGRKHFWRWRVDKGTGLMGLQILAVELYNMSCPSPERL